MRTLEDIYPNIFFKNRHKLSWRAEHIVDAIMDTIKPTAVIDCGAAIGDNVKEFNDRGVFCLGVEGSTRAKKHLVCDPRHMYFHDLRLPMKNGNRYDLTLCLEVFEHIEEEYLDVFLDNVCGLSNKLVASICTNRGGRHHVTLKPIGFWKERLEERGFKEDEGLTKALKYHLEPHCKNVWMAIIKNNIRYFEKGEGNET